MPANLLYSVKMAWFTIWTTMLAHPDNNASKPSLFYENGLVHYLDNNAGTPR
ncbi:hypothetical protein [Floridanema aerugineum]|uniref:Uncharacterized protein n=1 Tax=Floridaenema aerugineum BLCC-F46 TaxID=3153654 RepID=A0ABV4X792_9CYAN